MDTHMDTSIDIHMDMSMDIHMDTSSGQRTWIGR